jgi:hypothetical protein
VDCGVPLDGIVAHPAASVTTTAAATAVAASLPPHITRCFFPV